MLRTAVIASFATSCWAYSGSPANVESSANSLQQRRFGTQVHCDGMTHCSSFPPVQDICAAAQVRAPPPATLTRHAARNPSLPHPPEQVTRNGAWWRYIEKVKGQYDFTNIAKWVAYSNGTGSGCASGTGSMGLNFVLNGGNHLYGGTDQDSPKTQAQIQGYTNFVVAVASRFAGLGIVWEIYNEPDLDVRHMTAAQYAALAISVGKAIRANPTTRSETLMGPSASEMSCDYMQSMKQLGVLQCVDPPLRRAGRERRASPLQLP